MDLTTLEANKNITIQTTFSSVAGNTFTQTLYVPFTPDYMIVKAINYRAGGTTDTPGGYLVQCDFVPDPLGSFSVSETGVDNVANPIVISTPLAPNLIFKINKPIQGTYSFSLPCASGTNHNLNGDFIMHIDFIKLKVEKPQKIF